MKARTAAPVLVLLPAMLCWPAAAQSVVTQYPRVYALNYNPIIESSGGVRLNVARGWNDPNSNNALYIADLLQASHGLLRYRLTTKVDADEYPQKADGFRYTDAVYMASQWHQPDGVDYRLIAIQFDFARRVDGGEIDEVFMQGAPYFGYWESNMHGYGGYWCNSSPQPRIPCSRIYVVMGFNYERYIAEMLEDYAHRSESIMTYLYGGWNVNGDRTIWDRYGWNIGQTTVSTVYGVGSAHYPCNGTSDYDYANPQTVQSYADDWMNNFPVFNGRDGTPTPVSRNAWGGSDYHRNYLKWFFSHMPHVAGTNSHDGYTRLNNWWEYLQNFNAHAVSGGDHAVGGTAPAAQPYGGLVRTLTANTMDDWWPQANAAGRVVWAGWDGSDLELFSCDADGGNAARLTYNSQADEQPRINSSGKVVWQSFDGADYEIYTANADGTGTVRITNTPYHAWQPDLNNQNRIVWSGFDGVDFEIYSANADGTGLVQITNDSQSYPDLPRHDLWPRINHSGRVAWMRFDGTRWQVFSANADGTSLVNVSNNTYDNEFPQISDGGKVVWHAWHSNSNAEVYIANATGGSLVRMSNNSVMDWWPRINTAGDVVWMQRTTAGRWQILRRTAAGNVSQITSFAQHSQYPTIDDLGRVAWQGFDGTDWEIYLHQNNTIHQVTNNDYDDRMPTLAGDTYITWHGESVPTSAGRTTEIFLAGGTLDTTPPTLTVVNALSDAAVMLVFSEAVEETSAETIGNYQIDHGVTVLGAVLETDQKTVTLAVSPLTPDLLYTLTVSNVTDRAAAPNPIAPNTTVEFVYSSWNRATSGLVVLYTFDEGGGGVIHDVSGVPPALDLTLANPAAVAWDSGRATFLSPTIASSGGPAAKVFEAATTSNELTVEAWIAPLNTTQNGPARVVTMSADLTNRNFTLGQGLTGSLPTTLFDFRLRTSSTNANGTPSITTPEGSISTSLMHVVYTRTAAGVARLYIDNTIRGSGSVGGTIAASWNSSYPLALGNELTQDRPWLGAYQLVAIYGRALSAAEVTQNFTAGPEAPPVTRPGDTNCDGLVNIDDVPAMALALLDPDGFEAEYPGCDLGRADLDQSGVVDGRDIQLFVDLLLGR